MAVDADLVRRKLKRIGEFISQLEPLMRAPESDFESNYQLRYAAERLVELIVGAGSDIALHIVSELSNNPPDSRAEAFRRLEALGVVGADLGGELRWSVGLRNTIVHEYEAISPVELKQALPRLTEVYKRFVAVMEELLRRLKGVGR